MTDRKDVVALLRARGEHDRAMQAACALPAYVDPDEDAAVLAAYEVHPPDLRAAVSPQRRRG